MNISTFARSVIAALLISLVLIAWSNYVARSNTKALSECLVEHTASICNTVSE